MNDTQEAKTTAVKESGKQRSSSFVHVYRMALIGILSAAAFGLMMLDFPLVWVAPEFYKFDFSELPVIIGAFALGPVAGVIIEFLKNLLHIITAPSPTVGVGELANFGMGLCYILPASIIYYCKKSRRSAIIGLSVSTISCVILGSLLNAFVLLPMYCRVSSGLTMEIIIGMGTAVHKVIKDLPTFIFFAVAPFNLLKYGVASIITILIYKRISRILKNPMERV